MSHSEWALKSHPEQDIVLAGQHDSLVFSDDILEDSFEEIFHQYQGMIFNLAYRILGDYDDALDLSQDVFLTVFRKLNTFKAQSTLKTWLYRITVNKAVNKLRWWQVRKRSQTLSFQHLNHSSFVSLNLKLSRGIQTPENAFIGSEARSLYTDALLKIPLKYRTIIILRDIEDMTYDEIATSLGISLGTVKSRIARGREKLRNVLEKSM